MNVKCAVLSAAVLTAFLVSAAKPVPLDWSKAEHLTKGVDLLRFDEMSTFPMPSATSNQIIKARGKPYDGKREMKSYLMRIDLTLPGLKFTATGRDKDYGRSMPADPKNKSTTIIKTSRMRTVDFMREVASRLADNRKPRVLMGMNTGPWAPWPPPKHNYANPLGITISDGVVITDDPDSCRALFVVRKTTKGFSCEIMESLPQKNKNIWIAHTGFGLLLLNGKEVEPGPYEKAMMPRMAAGLSRDNKQLFVLAIDGRQPNCSWGATYKDMIRIFRLAGAWSAIDFDGGGSSSLCYWDEKSDAPVLVNKTENRHCGLNMVIYQ